MSVMRIHHICALTVLALGGPAACAVAGGGGAGSGGAGSGGAGSDEHPQLSKLPVRVHTLNAEAAFSACGVFDVNRDGTLDVVSGAWWYEGPAWTRHPVRDVEMIRGRYDGYSNLPIDLNGDGWTDFVSVNYRSQKLAWIEHPGRNLGAELGTWTEHVVATPGGMETGRLVDVDGDGQLDVLPNGRKFAAWWEVRPGEKGAAPDWTRHDLPDDVVGHGIGFGDIDGDGRGDVVGPAGWLHAPSERRTEPWIWLPEFTLDADASIPILVFDVDADGDNDIVWGRGHDYGLFWLEQETDLTDDEARTWRRHSIDESWSQAHCLLHVDLDGDGTAELIAGKRYMAHDGKDPGANDPLIIRRYQYDRQEKRWRQDTLSEGGRVGFGLDSKGVDLDHDGDLDLVVAGRSGLYWIENLRK